MLRARVCATYLVRGPTRVLWFARHQVSSAVLVRLFEDMGDAADNHTLRYSIHDSLAWPRC